MNIRQRSHDAATALRQHLLARLGSGELQPGDRLPTERELSETFGSGRATIRRTLDALEAEGVLTREVGRGTFVRAVPQAARAGAAGAAGGGAPAPRELAQELAGLPRLASPADVMELRLMLEPSVIEQTVLRGSPADIEAMDACLHHAQRAATLEEFEHWDDMLHRSFAAASRNPMFVAIYALIGAVRLEAQWGALKRRTLTAALKKKHFQEHVAIVDAVRERDAAQASALMLRHLRHIQANMFGVPERYDGG